MPTIAAPVVSPSSTLVALAVRRQPGAGYQLRWPDRAGGPVDGLSPRSGKGAADADFAAAAAASPAAGPALRLAVRRSRVDSRRLRVELPSRRAEFVRLVLWIVRQVMKIRNLDGIDDGLAAMVSALDRAVQPIVQATGLELGSPLVLISAIGNVREARHRYAEAYPERVRRQLLEQRAVLAALRRVPGVTREDLAALRQAHQAAQGRHALRELHRAAGFPRLLWHNFESWRSRLPDTDSHLRAFNLRLHGVLLRLAGQPGLSAEACLRLRLLRQAQDDRASEKLLRGKHLCSAVGMSGMFAGMQTAAGTSLSELARTTAAQAAGTVLGTLTSVVMVLSQVLQAGSGILGVAVEQRSIDQLRQALAQLQTLQGQLPPEALALRLEHAEVELAIHQVFQAFDTLLAMGQGLMAAGGISAAAGPGSLGAIVAGAVGTIVASVGRALQDHHQATFRGDDAHPALRDGLRTDWDGLAARLQGETLPALLAETGTGYLRQQQQVVDDRLWQGVLHALRGENVLEARSRRDPRARYRAFRAHGAQWRAGRHLLASGRARLRGQGAVDYPPAFFDRSALEIHQDLARRIRAHPLAARVEALPDFRQALYLGTLAELARREVPEARTLFHVPGGDGRLVEHIVVDDDFIARVDACPAASQVRLKHWNIQMVRFLAPGDRHGRQQQGEALSLLADTLHERQRMGLETPEVAYF